MQPVVVSAPPLPPTPPPPADVPRKPGRKWTIVDASYYGIRGAGGIRPTRVSHASTMIHEYTHSMAHTHTVMYVRAHTHTRVHNIHTRTHESDIAVIACSHCNNIMVMPTLMLAISGPMGQ